MITYYRDKIKNHKSRCNLYFTQCNHLPSESEAYVKDNDYGFYDQNNSKVSKPFGMLVVKTPGPSGIIKVKISKSLINNPDAFRYTIATFAPSQPPNLDTLFQGGSSAVDVFPGTKETFGGEINGYGESTPLGDRGVKNYTIYYVYNGINPIVEYAPNGSVLARYIYAGGRHIAKVAGADTHWYHCDALGSPRKMTDERGSTVWSATYYPFGEMTAGSNNTHGFTGKEFDSEMGLNYFCQRYYDPEVGRFMTRDLIPTPAFSSYSYCLNNPLKYIDVDGAVIIFHNYSWKQFGRFWYTATEYMSNEFAAILRSDYKVMAWIDIPAGIDLGGHFRNYGEQGELVVHPEIFNQGCYGELSLDAIICHELWHAYYATQREGRFQSPSEWFEEEMKIFDWMIEKEMINRDFLRLMRPKYKKELRKRKSPGSGKRRNKFPVPIRPDAVYGGGAGLFWDWDPWLPVDWLKYVKQPT